MLDAVSERDQPLRAPLAPFRGAAPPAPPWFVDALAVAPERSVVQVDGAQIELLSWGERGRPGLLFLHGGRAHADWFAHIAPFFAPDRRVAALSTSGSGRSSAREHYTIGQFAREMTACARAAGLYDDGGRPVFAAHSFGSRALLTAADPASGLGGAIVLDWAVSSPDAPKVAPRRAAPHQVFETLDQALARFRLAPPQPCDNLFILDHIARHSLRPAARADGGEGWVWRFDPFLMRKLLIDAPEDRDVLRAQADAALRAALCPLAFIRGEASQIVRADNLAYTRSIAPAGTRFLSVANAGHHLFLDQPQATVAAIRKVLTGWSA